MATKPHSDDRDRNQFARIRSDHASETAEDYVEAIAEIAATNEVCRVIDLSKYFSVSSVTVNRTITRLQRDGWVTTEPYGPVFLTPQGKKLAATCKHRHQVVRDFLLSLGVSAETAEVDAEGIEHHVSAETLNAMENATRQFHMRLTSQ